MCVVTLPLIYSFFHFLSSLVGGSESHKSVKKEGNYILYMYYTSRIVLFWVCAFNELFYVLLYCLHHQVMMKISTYSLTRVLLAVSAPIWAFKQIVNVIQMIGAAKSLAALDTKTKTQ